MDRIVGNTPSHNQEIVSGTADLWQDNYLGDIIEAHEDYVKERDVNLPAC